MPFPSTINYWDVATAYVIGDYVVYNGRVYQAIRDNTGAAAPEGNDDDWSLQANHWWHETPEAVGIPLQNPLARDFPLPPEIVISGAAAAKTIYDETKDAKCTKIFLQNLSMTALKYAWGQDCSEDSFHGVLAASAAVDDGLGGNVMLEVRERGMKSISLWCGGAAIRCSVEKFLKAPPVPQFI